MPFAFTSELRHRIQSNLATFNLQPSTESGHLRAAVGIVLLPGPEAQACFVLTRRPMTLRRHAGQFALPGGRLEPGESPEEAALREIHEEINLNLAQASILGRLDDFPTRS